MKKRLYAGDIAIVVCILAACIFAGLYFYMPSKDAADAFVAVTVDGTLYGTYSLNEQTDEWIADTGVRFIIEDGQARIAESDCPDGTCMSSGTVTASSPSGKSIVCLPNKVAVTKKTEVQTDGAESGVDAIVG
ncbi:MAG: NusG domain II-containing protein [Eubacteriales bacterium]